jgi:hypothetical protein
MGSGDPSTRISWVGDVCDIIVVMPVSFLAVGRLRPETVSVMVCVRLP